MILDRCWRIALFCLLFCLGVIMGVTDALNTTAWPLVNYTKWPTVIWQLGLGIIATAIVVLPMRTRSIVFPGPPTIVCLSFLFALLASLFVTGVWAGSADEYGYQYLADTFAHGRLWNEPAPAREVFDYPYIHEMDRKRFSQYSPGWPILLLPFLMVGLQQIANPILTLILAIILSRGLQRMAVPRDTISVLLVFTVLSPFVVFNGGSLFNGMLAATAVITICWLQIRHEKSPNNWLLVAIGLAFSILLTTRIEAFFILVVVYVVDRMILHHREFAWDAIFIGLGAVPVTSLLLAYHAAITGNPMLPPVHWVWPQLSWGIHGLGTEGPLYGSKAIEHLFAWTAKFAVFASLPFAGIYALALIERLRHHQIRFFDVLLPVTIGFFFFFPDFGGLQHGPRYWLFAWPPMALTIGSAFARDDIISVRKFLFCRSQMPQIAVRQIFAYLGVATGFSLLIGPYYHTQRAFIINPPEIPAVVLSVGPDNGHFSRNGVDFAQPVLFGRYNSAEPDVAMSDICKIKGRTIFLWRPPANFERYECPG